MTLTLTLTTHHLPLTTHHAHSFTLSPITLSLILRNPISLTLTLTHTHTQQRANSSSLLGSSSSSSAPETKSFLSILLWDAADKSTSGKAQGMAEQLGTYDWKLDATDAAALIRQLQQCIQEHAVSTADLIEVIRSKSSNTRTEVFSVQC